MRYRELKYNDLKINADDFTTMFDLSGSHSSFCLSQLRQIMDEASDWIFPQLATRKLNEIEIGRKEIRIGKTILHTGDKIAGQFRGADAVIIFVCTVGNGPSETYKFYSDRNDPLRAYFADALGSIAVEKSMDIFQTALNEEEKMNHKTLSNRYSPGYCGWPITEQHILFSLFPPAPCGVILNQSSWMQPVKSISGIIGIGDNLVFTEHSCQWCEINTCIYGKQKKRKTTIVSND